MGVTPIVATVATDFSARIVSRTELRYRHGASRAGDHPGHVRAASGLAWVGGRLYVVQDDIAVVAVIEPGGGVYPHLLPRGEAGRRRYEDALGNRRHKPDFEACCALAMAAGEVLAAFGSGSTAARRAVALVATNPNQDVRIVDAGAIYDLVEGLLEGEGPPNVEGVAVLGAVLRLLHRSNGRGRTGQARPGWMVDFSVADVATWLAGDRAEPPAVLAATAVDLGEEGGTAYSFSDGTATADGRLLYIATAEDSPDAIDDGPVMGSVLGVVHAGAARHARLLAEDGSVARIKAEGIARSLDDPNRVLIVHDPDDPSHVAELCQVVIDGRL